MNLSSLIKKLSLSIGDCSTVLKAKPELVDYLFLLENKYFSSKQIFQFYLERTPACLEKELSVTKVIQETND